LGIVVHAESSDKPEGSGKRLTVGRSGRAWPLEAGSDLNCKRELCFFTRGDLDSAELRAGAAAPRRRNKKKLRRQAARSDFTRGQERCSEYEIGRREAARSHSPAQIRAEINKEIFLLLRPWFCVGHLAMGRAQGLSRDSNTLGACGLFRKMG